MKYLSGTHKYTTVISWQLMIGAEAKGTNKRGNHLMVNRVGWSIKAIFKEEMSNYEELQFH